MDEQGAEGRRDRTFAAATAALAVLALATGLANLGLDDVWHDEAASLHFAALPLETLTGELARLDNHPPLYFLLLKAVQAATGAWHGEAAMLAGRGLSVACSAVAVVATEYRNRIMVAGFDDTTPICVQDCLFHGLCSLPAVCSTQTVGRASEIC